VGQFPVIGQSQESSDHELLQLCVFGLGCDQDGDAGVGIFPQREEILVRGAGFGRVALYDVSACEPETGQRASRGIKTSSS
jgi:hypothetical protein